MIFRSLCRTNENRLSIGLVDSSVFRSSAGPYSQWSVSNSSKASRRESAADFTGPIVSFLDGDTFEVLHNNKAERIRLSGINCQEKGQAFGTRAKHAASELVFGKDITLQTPPKQRSEMLS